MWIKKLLIMGASQGLWLQSMERRMNRAIRLRLRLKIIVIRENRIYKSKI